MPTIKISVAKYDYIFVARQLYKTRTNVLAGRILIGECVVSPVD